MSDSSTVWSCGDGGSELVLRWLWARPAPAHEELLSLYVPAPPSSAVASTRVEAQSNTAADLGAATRRALSPHRHLSLSTHFQIQRDLFMNLPNCILVLIHPWQVPITKESSQRENLPWSFRQPPACQCSAQCGCLSCKLTVL